MGDGMDNYQLAMMGVKIASEILHINAPEVRFFIDKNSDERSINAVFNPELYVIAFNENWLENVENNLEVMVTCFHESRHAFQYNIVNELYKGEEIVNGDTKKQWKLEFKNYHSGSGVPSKDSKYLVQDIEIDAIAFAHKMMLEHFEVKTIIPESIKEKVKTKLIF
ncbi:MAG: hypothetical protein RQ856_06685 [Candidatus Izemoplasmatales bacterium]|nr:hypothetical protein [Candidatus Izemoplasmatales bacterium]